MDEAKARKQLSHGDLERLRRLSTCVVASAVETFRVRLPNTGFADSTVQCIFKDRLPMLGYAVTARMRSAKPPISGRGYYYERTEWWNNIVSIPAPRVVVIEDVDHPPGLGAFVGEVNTQILLALGCAGLVTNGAVRDVDHVERSRFQMFARNVAVSHVYSHIFDFGSEVELGGLKIRPGDLVHGDRHGVQTIPTEIADKIPARADEISEARQRLIGVCRAPDFSVDKLRQAIQEEELRPWER